MIAKVFRGIWAGINFSRRLILNILFLLLVVVFFMSLSSDDDTIIIEDGSVLRLNLNGPIVEEKTDTLKDKIFPKKKSEGRLSKKIKQLEQTINVIQSDIKIIKSRLGL